MRSRRGRFKPNKSSRYLHQVTKSGGAGQRESNPKSPDHKSTGQGAKVTALNSRLHRHLGQGSAWKPSQSSPYVGKLVKRNFCLCTQVYGEVSQRHEDGEGSRGEAIRGAAEVCPAWRRQDSGELVVFRFLTRGGGRGGTDLFSLVTSDGI